MSFTHGNKISLLSAYSAVNYTHGFQSQSGSVKVLVKNESPDKQVAVHMKDAHGQWVDVPLSYAGPAYEGFELWTGEVGKVGTPLDPIEFAVKVTMNGQTYWDNRGGANYRLRSTQGTRLFGPLVLNAFGGLRSDGSLYVNIDVQNTGYQKRVQVVYTTDDWATVRTGDASFMSYYGAGGGGTVPSPNAYDVERWLLEVNGIPGNRVQYAISYTVNGQTYWDNNFGHNYVVTRQ